MSDDNTNNGAEQRRSLLSSSTGRGEDNLDSLLLDEDDLEDIDIEKQSNLNILNQEEFELRIKCNSPGIDPPNQALTGGDWYSVTTNLGVDVKTLKQQVRDSIGETARGRYMRLIAKGRLLAPDSTLLKEFQFKTDECTYIHAVVAPVGVRGGQQAVMAQTDGEGTSTSGGSSSQSTTMSRRALRSVGVGPTGLILARRPNGDSDTDSSAGEEDEAGTTTTNTNNAGDVEAGTGQRGGRTSRRNRERRGFDRLRNGTAPGLSSLRLRRDEIAAIRLYFRRSVDQFAERRRRRERRQQRRTTATETSATAVDEDGIRVTGTSNADNTLDGTTAESGNTNNNATSSTTVESGGDTATPSSPVTSEAQRRLERFIIEEEWMAAQSPMSEFRMNLRTTTANAATLLSHRSRMGLGGSASIFDTGGIRGDGSRMGAGRGANNNPLASSSVGNDRDFMWGFFMGFFVGFVMLFWVWLPTVSHKQKIGILTGISCQLGFNMLHQGAKDNVLSNTDSVLLDNATTSGSTAANSSLVGP